MPVRSRRSLIQPNLKRRSAAYPRAGGGFVAVPGARGLPVSDFRLNSPGLADVTPGGAGTFARASTQVVFTAARTFVELPSDCKPAGGCYLTDHQDLNDYGLGPNGWEATYVNGCYWDIEPPSTNLLTGSCKIDNSGADWFGSASLVFTPATPVVQGQIANLVQSNGTSGRSIRQTLGSYLGVRTLTFLVERGDSAESALGIFSDGGGGFTNGGRIEYDWVLGVVGSHTGNILHAGVENLGLGPNGAEMIVLWVTIDCSSTIGTLTHHFFPNGVTSTDTTGCYIHAGQAENLPFTTALIITPSGSTTSRASASWNFPSAGNLDLSKGSAIVVDWVPTAEGKQFPDNSESGLVGAQAAAAGILYNQIAVGVPVWLRSFDGASKASLNEVVTALLPNQKAARWSSTSGEFSVSLKAGGNPWAQSSPLAFAGAFPSDGLLHLFFGAVLPQRIGRVDIYLEDKGQVFIEGNY